MECDGWLCNVVRAGRRPDTAEADHGQEVAQLPDLHAITSISYTYITHNKNKLCLF
jgi:hypothetical protein